ncbi:MAG: glutamate--tRNA ligase [Bacteroidota bacterium]
MSDKVRVRFAPSPTGPLHIGGVRTALYNFLFARKNEGDLILRIEDTDQKRFVPKAEEYIQHCFDWLGIEFDESPRKGGGYGPYKQSERSEFYNQHIKKLMDDGNAYYAFDTSDQLAEKRAESSNWTYNAVTRGSMKNSLSLDKAQVRTLLEQNTPYVIRVKIPENKEIKIIDSVRGEVVFQSQELDDKVLIKEDGLPTYHFANIVDDHLMKISHVIRGEEWLSSAPLHQLLYEFQGWTAPKWVHLPLIMKPNGKGKLSKRDGEIGNFPVFPLEWMDQSSGAIWHGFKEDGYFPEALINILAFLGWNPGTEKEIYALDELFRDFSLERINSSGASFNPDKAKWYNKEYLQAKKPEELVLILKDEFEKRGKDIDNSKAQQVMELMKSRAHFVHEMTEVDFVFAHPENYDEKTQRKKWKEGTPEILSAYSAELNKLSEINEASIESQFKSFLEEKEISMGALMPNLRLALTGMGSGPSLYKIIEILGVEEAQKRINIAIAKIHAQD